MFKTLNILVVDGYPKTDRDNLAGCGMTVAGELYSAMLQNCGKDIGCNIKTDIIYASDSDGAIPGGSPAGYDGMAWTGCSLNVYDDDPRVHRQIELQRAAFNAKVPSFGSCWAIQIAAVAVGGEVKPNPRGREVGITRKIALNNNGRNHPLYRGKPDVFDAFISHIDEVTNVGSGGAVLAGNDFTAIQAMSIENNGCQFWGVQYHPEYDLYQMARLVHCRTSALIKEGFFKTEADAAIYVKNMEQLHLDPNSKSLSWLLAVDDDIVDTAKRQTETRNWLQSLKQG